MRAGPMTEEEWEVNRQARYNAQRQNFLMLVGICIIGIMLFIAWILNDPATVAAGLCRKAGLRLQDNRAAWEECYDFEYEDILVQRARRRPNYDLTHNTAD